MKPIPTRQVESGTIGADGDGHRDPREPLARGDHVRRHVRGDRDLLRRARADERALARDDLRHVARVFAGGAQFLAVATIASGGTPLAAVLGGIVLNARHLPYGLAVAPLLRGPLWKRALSSQIVLDESTALALSQPTPELGRLAFYACGCSLFVAWNLGTLVGALAGGAIADPSALGLDAAFPASLVALLAPLLRRPEMRAAALTGGVVALVATPFTAPGIPILLAAAGAVVARFARRDPE